MEESINYKIGSTGSHIRELQKILSDAGYVIPVDGIFGPKTRLAVEEFEADLSLSEHSLSFSVDPETLRLLFQEGKQSSNILFPKGKGIFVRSANQFGDLSNLEKQIKDLGISWVAVQRIRQFSEGRDRHLNSGDESEWIHILDKCECDIWVWGWPVPSKIDEFVSTLEETREKWNAVGIIADVEGDFLGRKEEAEDLSAKLQSLGCPVGITSYGLITKNSRFPFSAFLGLDFGIPQIYESTQEHFSDSYPTSCITSWKEAGFKKVIPASCAFKDGEEMKDLLSRTPVEDSIIWWDWHNARLRRNRFETIRDFKLLS